MNSVCVYTRCSAILLAAALVVGAMVIGGAGQGAASSAINPEQCCRCHSEVCEETATKRYVHAPVLDNHCAVCHVKGTGTSISQQVAFTEREPEIDWFAKDCQEKTEHWFELAPQLAGSNVTLMVKADGNQIFEEQVALPPLPATEPLPLPAGAPQIADLRVAEVKRGVFISARITWRTDRLANAQLLYGEKYLDLRTAVDSRWARDHEITITGLKANEQYQVVATSSDILGNEVRSTPIPLSTHEFFSESTLAAGGLPAGGIEVAKTFYRQNGRLFARFATDYPVAMRLGRNSNALLQDSDSRQDSLPGQHLELTDPYALTITVCVQCHPQAKGALSHPVDIRPKSGMFIPPEYKTMADGRLSCMSCHQAHASDNEYRLTRARRKDLCLGCHRNFG